MMIENGSSQPLSDLSDIGTTPSAAAAAPDQRAADAAAPDQAAAAAAPEQAAAAAAPQQPVEADEGDLQDFDSLINGYLEGIVQHEVESVITVRVVEVHSGHVLVDLGDKAEGVIDIQEFFDPQGNVRISVGDTIDVQVLGRNDETGLIEVSHRKARAQGAWKRLTQAHADKTTIHGTVTRAVKSGVLVDVGIECFMPASQISDHRTEKLEEWIGKEVEAVVLDLDERKHRAVLSRRTLIEAAKKSQMAEALTSVNEGDIVQGTVRSIQNFGAFVSIGSLDALLPREELSWERGANPASILEVGIETKVKILTIDRETGRIRVSRKAVRPDPWETVEAKHPKDSVVRGEVVSLTNFGAFVRIEEGLTGLIHVSDMSWSREPREATEHVKEGDSVRAVVLGIDKEKRRLSLGLKQMVEDPWVEAERQFPKGSRVTGTVTNLAPYGAFVRLTDMIEGLIHISDFSWDQNLKHPGEVLKVGQEVEAQVVRTDATTRRISLGLKQMTESPVERFLRDHPTGATVEGEVVRIIPAGAFLSLLPAGMPGKLEGFLPVSQMSTERVEKPEHVVKVGEKVECKIIKVEKAGSRISLSRKALIQHQEREAIRQYGGDPGNQKGGMKLGELLQGIRVEHEHPAEGQPEEKKPE